jgi:hypothetical protein
LLTVKLEKFDNYINVIEIEYFTTKLMFSLFCICFAYK